MSHQYGEIVPSLIPELCQKLDTEAINYCHWKSNNALDRTLRAETDLDLLVACEHAQRFIKLLFELDFKQANAPHDKSLPGVLDFYGLDQTTSKLVHVHAHFQLVLGHDTTKNYRLPIEPYFLLSKIKNGIFWVPQPELEYIVFVIRMMLKHFTWDAVAIKHGKMSSKEYDEHSYLHMSIDRTELLKCLDRALPFLNQTLFFSCENALSRKTSTIKRILVGRKLLSTLRPYSRRPRYQDVLLKFGRRFKWLILRKLIKKQPKRRLSNGGTFIAIVGGDGAGKSTSVEHLCTLLSKDFDLLRMHLGKPKWSLTTYAVRAVLKLGRMLGLYSYVDHTVRYYAEDPEKCEFAGYPCLIREVCTARDRYLTFKKGFRYRTNGGIVICDRYTVEGIKLMEGPVVRQLAGSRSHDRIIAFLIQLEENFYTSICKPETLIILRLDPEIAIKRKPEEDERFVRIRSTEIWSGQWSEPDASVIDSSISKESLLRRVRHIAWSSM